MPLNNKYPVQKKYIYKCIQGCAIIDRLLGNYGKEFQQEFINTTYYTCVDT